jgi:plastocyanin
VIPLRAWVVAVAAVVALVAAAFVPAQERTRSLHTVTAIDYHFHDAHPTPPMVLGATLRFLNQGRSLHNVSFPETGYSVDIEPGGEIVIEQLSDLFDAPGRYELICNYHSDRGMTGVVVIIT